MIRRRGRMPILAGVDDPVCGRYLTNLSPCSYSLTKPQKRQNLGRTDSGAKVLALLGFCQGPPETLPPRRRLQVATRAAPKLCSVATVPPRI